jgi:hypothetical protein
MSNLTPQTDPALVPYVPATKTGLASAGLVLGITSVLFCFLGVFSLAQVVLAIVFASIGLSRAGAQDGAGKGRSIAGLTLGVVGFISYLFVGIATLGVGFFI